MCISTNDKSWQLLPIGLEACTKAGHGGGEALVSLPGPEQTGEAFTGIAVALRTQTYTPTFDLNVSMTGLMLECMVSLSCLSSVSGGPSTA